MKPNQQRGVALVITLIMLSVITFLAVAFLALTRRDKAAVNVSLTQTDSRFMADTALARAEAELVSRIIATTNMLNFDLLLTRNYINPNGFVPGNTELTNVSYNYNDGTIIDEDDHIENVYNLFYDPRPPVYIKTNENEPLDFRYYIDINRNGRFDTNGMQLVLDDGGQPVDSTNFVLNWGDPEWIGVPEKPQYRHSPTNRFLGRYAFIVLPEGKSLDVNFMHNNAKGLNMGGGNDGFLRNQGVGSWELNLAAFLQDLNTNLYETAADYVYRTDNNNNTGGSFNDALSILSFRYRTNHNNLDPAQASLGTPSIAAFANDLIDNYANGPLLTNFLNFTNDNDNSALSWSGSRNPQAFRNPQELWDANKTSIPFVNRLTDVVARSNSHDGQTFTRLLSQLGTTSDTNNTYVIAGKTYSKIHLNYDNVSKNTDNFASQTNFFEWEPLTFFTNAAEALIQQSLIRADAANDYIGGLPVGKDFSLTNIMVYPTNQYTPTVHRLLQLAANIYSARSNHLPAVGVTNFPVVFRPQFKAVGSDIFISGYVEVIDDGDVQFNKGFRDLSIATERGLIAGDPNVNVAGIPWVVSAAKRLPNFNEFSFETAFQITRKMEMKKTQNLPLNQLRNVLPNETNLMYIVGITNYVGAEFWNSYTTAFTADITVRFTNHFRATLTNQFGSHLTNRMPERLKNFGFTRTPASIPGTIDGPGNLNTNSFLADHRSINLLPTSAYFGDSSDFEPASNAEFRKTIKLEDPDWDLLITNQVAAIVTHDDSKRVLDFVNLGNVVTHINLSKELQGPEVLGPGEMQPADAVWATDRFRNVTSGMMKQIQISKGDDFSAPLWKNHSPLTEGNLEDQIDQFRYFLKEAPRNPNSIHNPTNRIQVPFTPTRLIYVKSALQANDPLVHHMAGDLVEPGKTGFSQVIVPGNRSYYNFSEHNLWNINNRYSPWGGRRIPGATTGDKDELDFQLAVKDPLVRWSDDWDFPTNKFPNIGWLGRVHRGSPWQTVYLKAAVAKREDWSRWSGSGHTHPTNDWPLLDLFTAAPNDNAARGHLSVNQAGVASWSAVLSGVLVLSNSLDAVDALTKPEFESLTIEPSSEQLNKIVNAINQARANRTNNNQVFSSVGQILAAPELTTASPFLNQLDAKQKQFGLNDAAYERIPQQILSLLKVGQPRFAIYSYGQALRPAPNSIVISPPLGSRYLQNLCTNYQIAGEVVTKTVLRVEGTPENPKAIVESFEIISEN